MYVCIYIYNSIMCYKIIQNYNDGGDARGDSIGQTTVLAAASIL